MKIMEKTNDNESESIEEALRKSQEREQKLKESEERYRNLVENAQEGVWAVDENDDTIFVNPKICDMLGYTKDEMMGKNLSLFLEDSMMEFVNSYRKRREKGLKDLYDLEFIKKDGTLISTSVKAASIMGEKGEFKGSFAYISDITSRKIAEQKLKESEQKYRNILDNIMEGYFEEDINGVFTFVNDYFGKILGLPKEEILGMDSRSLFDRETNKMLREKFTDLFENKVSPPITFVVQTLIQKKRKIYCEGLSDLKYDSEGKIIGFYGLIRDITERKIAEQKLQKSQEQLNTILSSQKDIVLVISEDQKVLFKNETAQDLFGKELVGKNCYEIIKGLDHPCERCPMKRFAESDVRQIRFEQCITLPSTKETRFFDIIASHIEYYNEKPSIVAVFRDITENRKIREELTQANIHLKSLDRLKSMFLASMSHELRTPLNSIIGFTGWLLMGMEGDLNEEQKKQLTMVENSADHLLGLINDILDISKIEAGKLELFIEKFEIAEVVNDVVSSVQPLAEDKGLNLLHDVPEGVILNSDKRRIRQVLINLVSNAIKFTDQGNVQIEVKLLNNNDLEVIVSDSGMGIKKEDMELLFQPFQQIDMSSTKKHEGTGLGLYLCKKILDLLHGDISVKSQFGKGSEFKFIIPIKLKVEV